MKTKSLTVSAITIAFCVLFTLVGYNVFKGFRMETSEGETFYRAKIVSVDGYSESLDYFRNIVKITYFSAQIRNGSEKGAIVSCSQETGGAFNVPAREVEKGDSIFLYYNADGIEDEGGWIFAGYNRVNTLIILCASFLGLIVLIGRAKGINTVISLVFTCMAIFLVYIPSILSGVNVYLSTIIVGIYIIIMTLVLINGVESKTRCAILGNIGGVIVAALLAHIMNNVMKMTGMINEEIQYLSLTQSGQQMDLMGVVWGGTVLGALGAIMDVAMTIASSIHELHEYMDKKSFVKLFKSGLNIGRDAIGTMTNTLILAYIGGSFALVMLIMLQSTDTYFLFSTEMISSEIIQAVVGSMGILFSVPLTAFFSAYLYSRS